MVLKSILHGQMTEKIAFEVRPKIGEKSQKVPLLKSVFWPLGPLGGQKKLYHMKFKSKISYLGEKNSILPWQMAEQLAVEVDVKNVTEYTAAAAVRRTSPSIWFGLFVLSDLPKL